MQGYIYLTTCLSNNKKYVGRKTSSTFVKDYFGSGVHLQNALKKYGTQNFKVEIIEEVDDKNDLIDREMYWIKYFNAVEDDNFYNHSPGGYNEGFEPGEKNIAKTSYSRQRNSDYHKGIKYSEDTIEKRVNTFKENHENGLHKKYKGAANWTDQNRKEQSVRTKQYNATKDYSSVSIKTTGKKFMHKDGVQTWVMKNDIEKYLNDGWKFGSCNKRKRKSPAWNKGLKSKCKAHNSNKIAITDGVITKYILKEELDEYIQLGFKKGMKPREKKLTD